MRQGSKQVVKKEIVVESSGEPIKRAFELFDENNGKMNVRNVRTSMQNIGYDENNPIVYQVAAELDTNSNAKSGGVSFDDFCKTVNERIPDKETNEQLRKVYELFLDNPDSSTTTLSSIKRVADELGENYDEAELQSLLRKATNSGGELTFDDFVSIMKSDI